MKKHIHFIGIAGKAMAPLAKMFKDMGWQVTGSDHGKTYPPVSTYLQVNKINYHEGYAAENFVGQPDLVVAGRSSLLVDPQNPEYLKARQMGLKIFSFPEVLKNYLVKKNSIVVAGTYGKTTTSALLAWILEKANFDPAFMTGGVPLNFSDGIRNTDSLWSVIEGDETSAMKETDPPKFMFFAPKYLVLTACQWDHLEIFRSEEDYIQAFVKLVRLLPKDGLLVACLEGKNIKEVAKEARCPVVWYSAKKMLNPSNTAGRQVQHDIYWIENISFDKDFTRFEIVGENKRLMIESPLLGNHNVQNVCGAVALGLKLKIDSKIIQEAVKTFEGIKTRLEFVGELGGIKIYWDLAQHPVKVKATIAALRVRYQDTRIICIFDPHQGLLKRRESLNWYSGCFDLADEVIVTKMDFSKSIPKEERVTGIDIVEAIKETQPKVCYSPIDEKVIDYLTGNTSNGDVIIFMSSGGRRVPWIIQKLLKN